MYPLLHVRQTTLVLYAGSCMPVEITEHRDMTRKSCGRFLSLAQFKTAVVGIIAYDCSELTLAAKPVLSVCDPVVTLQGHFWLGQHLA